MAALSTSNIVNSGTAPTFVAASTSDTAEVGSGGNTFVVYRNAHASETRTVTIVVAGDTEYGTPLPDPQITVPATGEAWIPMRRAYMDETGRATLTATNAADLTVAVVRMS